MNGWVTPIAQNLLASLLWTVFVGILTLLIDKGWRRWQQQKRLRALHKIAGDKAVALCVRVGGRGEPLSDVQAFLREHQPAIKTILYYDAPTSTSLSDPSTANTIIEDLREATSELGRNQLAEIHYFPAGMVAYPFIMGAMLSNWCPVVVYHLEGGKYMPLYRLDKEVIHSNHRTTQSLATLQAIPLKVQAASPVHQVATETHQAVIQSPAASPDETPQRIELKQ